ncbi:MAG: ABC transporter permease, partial [Phycisphaerales bacterium]
VIDFFGAICKVPRATRRERTERLLELVGMREWAGRKVTTYSKGMQQRIGIAAALRTGSGEAVQGLFPIMFTLLFLSTVNLPLDLIPVDWFRWIATVNPISFLIDAIRSLIITGWEPSVLLVGFAVALGIMVLGVALAAVALRGRLLRT